MARYKPVKVDTRKTPVTIRGVRYDSVAEAARALNLTESVVWRARKNGPKALARCGLGRGRGIPVPTTVDGVTYPSRWAASKALNIPIDKLRER